MNYLPLQHWNVSLDCVSGVKSESSDIGEIATNLSPDAATFAEVCIVTCKVETRILTDLYAMPLVILFFKLENLLNQYS